MFMVLGQSVSESNCVEIKFILKIHVKIHSIDILDWKCDGL